MQAVVTTMRMGEMTVVRNDGGSFEFSLPHGEEFIATSLGISRADEAPLWWIVSEEYSEPWTAVEGQELVGAEAEKAAQALDTVLPVANGSGQSVSRISYGEVPAGFHQVVPERGAPEELRPGVRYVLRALGNHAVVFEFTI